MTTIIRVKRHRQDEPVGAVLFACKRRKTEEAENLPSFEKVLSFSGTVEEKDNLVAQRTVASFVDKQKVAGNIKNHATDVLDKIRKEHKAKTDENRFKVISCLRSVNATNDLDVDGKEPHENLAIFDVSVESDHLSEDAFSTDDAFVYDLYSAHFGNEEFNDIFLDNVVGIEPFTTQTHLSDLLYRNPEDYSEEYIDPDDYDSNDENNWRNFYPDSDAGSDSDEAELTSQWGKLAISDGYELSSDEGEESYANYYDKNNKKNYCYYAAEDLGGSKYAKYKMNVLKDLSSDVEEDEDEETF